MAASSLTTSVKLDAKTRARIQRLADARDRSPHWPIRKAVERYIDREEALKRVRRDAIAAWELYRATGRHVSAEDRDAWLAQLEIGDAVEPPR